MARTDSSHGFMAVRTEGAILPPSFLLDSVSTLKAKNQSGPDYGPIEIALATGRDSALLEHCPRSV